MRTTSHQFQILQINPKENVVKKDYTPHNSTCCREWVGKTKLLHHDNVSLAQSDENVKRSSVSGFDLSSLNITSISHNKVPEYLGPNPKFIS